MRFRFRARRLIGSPPARRMKTRVEREKKKKDIAGLLYVRMKPLERARCKWQIGRRYSTLYRGTWITINRATCRGYWSTDRRNWLQKSYENGSSDNIQWPTRIPNRGDPSFRATSALGGSTLMSSCHRDRIPLLRSRKIAKTEIEWIHEELNWSYKSYERFDKLYGGNYTRVISRNLAAPRLFMLYSLRSIVCRKIIRSRETADVIKW